MTSTIYYFSATGNTLHIAKIMADKMGAELLPMTSSMGAVCDSGRIGFLFPTYFWGAPRTVVSFINKLNITAQNPYIFAVSTCGGVPGGVLGFTQQLLARRNLQLSYGKTITSVANFIEKYNPRVKSAAKLTNRAEQAAEQAAEQIMAGVHTKIRRATLIDKRFYKIYTDQKLDQDRGFHADGRCTGCGICANVCPNRNIVIKDGRPEFQHHCEHCTACIHWCPQTALQWNNSTQTRSRYHHPAVSLKEIVEEMQ